MAVKVLCIIMVFVLLMEDSSSVRKKSSEEEKEDEKIAEAVNATLAAEEEEKRKEDEKKKRTEDDTKGKKEDKAEKKDVKGKVDQQESQNEAGPSLNCTCPVVKPCRPCQNCPVANCTGQCDSCPEVKECPEVKPCLPCDDCGPCPEVRPCKPCRPCGPCGSDSVIHNETTPSVNQCPENRDLAMTIPVAMAVGAAASFLVIGVATAVGLVIRYVPPTVSGFLFLSTIIMVWYLSSQYPAVARKMGERVVTVLREATVTLGNRVMVALQRHQEQVGFSNPNPLVNPIF
jgi:hypothetical protein